MSKNIPRQSIKEPSRIGTLMTPLKHIYGRKTYLAWQDGGQSSLEATQTDAETASRLVWQVSSFTELIDAIAFLTSMNKRHVLLFRGQTQQHEPLPMLFRPQWRCFGTNDMLTIGPALRAAYWEQLHSIGNRVYEICTRTKFGLPRGQGLRETREVQWAVIQHYELWPTPLIDLTSSPRVAASFALAFKKGTAAAPQTGYLYAAGMPNLTGSIAFNIDEQLCLLRLQSACPPIAKRPHYQDGYLVGRFPIYNIDANEKLAVKCNLRRRVVAKFKLIDKGTFWTDSFPMVDGSALYPSDDDLQERFLDVFGPKGEASTLRAAKTLGAATLPRTLG
jgi:hypothetical protein